MRSLKLISVAILFATVLVNSANAGERTVQANNIAINITFQQAIQDPGLVAAMHKQLTGGFLGGPGVQYITLSVVYNNRLYLITGSVAEWTLFFNSNGFNEKPRNSSIGKLINKKSNEML